MEIPFVKYQGTGNDFVMIDNRSGKWNDLSINLIRSMCDRRFGIGADGLIKINAHTDLDFEVDYYNSDGSKSFCGNGARCAVAFAKTKGINTSHTHFMAIDGAHEASHVGEIVSLLMNNVNAVSTGNNDYILNTGSPHFIRFIDDVEHFPVYEEGFAVRYSETYKKEGINVNFVQVTGDRQLYVRTYERGVEAETLSCGTGVTAAALAFAAKNGLFGEQTIGIQTPGGQLQVQLDRTGEAAFEQIYLIGPAVSVFEGVYNA
jgi:diaminopimelate epimerase